MTAATEEPTYTDEDFLKTRLLIDGDGTGDDRRLNTLHKLILRFAHMDEESPEEVKKQYERAMALLATCQWIDERTKLVQAMNQTELRKCQEIYTKIEDAIQDTHTLIEQEREELKAARKVRRNRMEYDALAKEICKNPDRNTTGRKLDEIQEEIDNLKQVEDALDEKLEMRKKQFHVLVHSIHELQRLLDADRDEDFASTLIEAKNADEDLDTSNISSEEVAMDAS
eukprot:maker-scaffold237_size242172-snap-gene-0.14 protein:Tk05162 transcript:maker-scaffold237_size242172-snap-gene-0.14-mRNA-1 annotation:"tho complex subunit 7 homolog"